MSKPIALSDTQIDTIARLARPEDSKDLALKESAPEHLRPA